MDNISDTLPFINRFNYLVKEISSEEFLKVLSQLDDDDDGQSRNEELRNRITVYH